MRDNATQNGRRQLVDVGTYKIYRDESAFPGDFEEEVVQLNEDTMSADQRARYFEVCTWIENTSESRPQVRTLGGYAGTGKTALIAQLAKKYNTEFSIAYCAFTGKAANLLRTRLRRYGVRNAVVGTIHSLLYKAITDDRGRLIDWMKQPLDEYYDLIIVDEASMVDEKLFTDLRSAGVPILAVGDHGQLPPINSDFNLMEKPELRLEKIHRQAESSPIISLSQHVRENGRLPSSWEYGGNDVQIVSKREIRSVIQSVYNLSGVSPLDVGLLTFSNKSRVALNRTVREIWGGKDFASSDGPVRNDVVICLRNISRLIFNGMRGRVDSFKKPSAGGHPQISIQFPEEELYLEGLACAPQFNRPKTFSDMDEYEAATGIRPYKMKDIGLLFDFGYALTVHKSQGSGFRYVILVDDVPPMVDADTYRRWLYTGITRSSSHLVVLR